MVWNISFSPMPRQGTREAPVRRAMRTKPVGVVGG